MTPEQIVLVQDSFRELVPDREDVAAMFYNRLFAIDPSAKPLFDGVDLEAQGRMLMGALAMVINTIEDPESLLGPLAALGRRHAAYGVQRHHYASVGRALIATLQLFFRDRFTRAMHEAWLAAFTLVATVMQEADDVAPAQDAA